MQEIFKTMKTKKYTFVLFSCIGYARYALGPWIWCMSMLMITRMHRRVFWKTAVKVPATTLDAVLFLTAIGTI